ncbi:MAG: hypothetical protein ABH954_00245, partial [Candidatus Omnitrophota bacterium]
MRTKSYIIIALISIFCLFKFGCSFGTPVEQMVKRVKQADIISYDLEWLAQEGQKQEYISISKGGESAVINNIKQAMGSVVAHTESGWNYIWLKPLGILRFKTSDGQEERIDITKACFFAGGNRIETAAFYSPALSSIIKKMFYKAAIEHDLLTTESLFEDIAKGGAFEYLIKPEVREKVFKGIKEKLQ